MSDEKNILDKLEALHAESVATRKTTERALSELVGRVTALEQWRLTADEAVQRAEEAVKRADSNWEYTRDKLDAIDGKVDVAREKLARYGGFGAALLLAIELGVRLIG